MSRPNWDIYFLELAYHAARRATCDRAHVGAVLVDLDHRVVATGYNGAPSGQDDCDTEGHMMHNNSCVRTLHAESNAIDYAGIRCRGCCLYTTIIPCFDCAKRIVNAGIVRVVYNAFYPSRYGLSDQVVEYFKGAGVDVVQIDKDAGLERFKEYMTELDRDPQ